MVWPLGAAGEAACGLARCAAFVAAEPRAHTYISRRKSKARQVRPSGRREEVSAWRSSDRTAGIARTVNRILGIWLLVSGVPLGPRRRPARAEHLATGRALLGVRVDRDERAGRSLAQHRPCSLALHLGVGATRTSTWARCRTTCTSRSSYSWSRSFPGDRVGEARWRVSTEPEILKMSLGLPERDETAG